jgi:hypothetical protein
MQETRFDVASVVPNIFIKVYFQLLNILLSLHAVEDLLAVYDGR